MDEQLKLEIAKQIGERAKYDLFYMAKFILGGGELIDPKVHGPLCASFRHLLFKDNPEESLKYQYPSDYGRTEEEGMPNEVQKAIFQKWQSKFEPDVDAKYVARDKIDITLTSHLYLMPRGTLKTSVITIAGTIQWLFNFPEDRVAIDSETVTKAQGFMTEIKGHFEENEKLRDIWFAKYGHYPDRDSKKKKWSTEGLVLATRTKSRKEPSIDALGPGVARNGWHYDIAFLDDLHSELNTKTKERIEEVKEHRKLVYSLLDPGAPQIVIGTRWSFADMYQDIIDEEYEDFNFITRSALAPDGEEFYPRRLSTGVLKRFRRIQGAYLFSCNPGDAPILMADWTVKRIDEVRVGDEIIGFEPGVGTAKAKLVKTTVTEVNSRMAATQKVLLDSGREIRCTPDHQWYTGRNDPTHAPYAPVHLGSKMLEVVDTDEREMSREDIMDWGYISGMIDGEGSAKHGSIFISQSEEHHPKIVQRIADSLTRQKLPFTSGKDYVHVNGGKQSKFDIIRYANPEKRDQIVGTLWKRPGMPARRKSRVVEITPHKRERVYALTTSTGNYVAWGMMSKNCQYMNNPVSDETAVFKKEDFRYLTRHQMTERRINWYGLVDPSYEGPYSDYCAIVIAGIDHEGRLYIKHIVREKMTYAGIIDKMFELNGMFKLVRWGLETVGTQKSIEYTLAEKERERGMSLRVHKFKSRSRTKEERIRALAPFYEDHKVYHCAGMSNLLYLEDELSKFPRAKNDDVSDCFSGILEIGVRATSSKPNEKNTSANNKEYITMLNKPRSPMVGY